MAKKQITPGEYAALRKITLQAVTEALRKSRDLPGVKKIEKFGRFYLLTVDLEKNGNLKITEEK